MKVNNNQLNRMTEAIKNSKLADKVSKSYDYVYTNVLRDKIKLNKIALLITSMSSIILIGSSFASNSKRNSEIGVFSRMNNQGKVDYLGVSQAESLQEIMKSDKKIKINTYLEPNQVSAANKPNIKMTDASALDYLKEINIASLQKINKQLVGWLVIPELNIEQPILKANDDFYLSHNSANIEDHGGAIYTDTGLDKTIVKIHGKAWNRTSLLGPLARMYNNNQKSVTAYVLNEDNQVKTYILLGLRDSSKDILSDMISFSSLSQDFNSWAESYYNEHSEQFKFSKFRYYKKILFLEALDCSGDNNHRIIAYFQEV